MNAEQALKVAREALETCKTGGYTDVDGDWCERQSHDRVKVAAALAAIKAAEAIPAQAVASIDTPEFQLLAEYWRDQPNCSISSENAWGELIGHINAAMTAYGQQQRIEGRRDAHETNVTLLMERDKMRERAETAEAALAGGELRRARKIGGSYQAAGTVVSEFRTLAGEQRFVFEFDEPKGMLHIFGPQQISFE